MIKWILGSGSPRRKELLSGIGVDFEIRVKDTSENYDSEMPVEQVPEYLASLKAAALLPDLAENEAVICADTVVILNHEIIGKPKDREDAVRMLTHLSGNTHRVITGVFVGNESKQRVFSETAWVTFKQLTAEEINYYIDHYQPFDKAGSYGIQEWIGYVAITRLEGTYTNVMGLPTSTLYDVLKNFK